MRLHMRTNALTRETLYALLILFFAIQIPTFSTVFHLHTGLQKKKQGSQHL